MTTTCLGILFGRTEWLLECIADGLGFNSALLEHRPYTLCLGRCRCLILAQTLGSRNTTLRKLTIEGDCHYIYGVGVLLETREHSSHITGLELRYNVYERRSQSLASSLITCCQSLRASLCDCAIYDDGFIAVGTRHRSKNVSLLKIDLCTTMISLSWALAESYAIKMLQQLDLSWCTGLASVMPLLLQGIAQPYACFCFHVTVVRSLPTYPYI
jgi:hypothetical protein